MTLPGRKKKRKKVIGRGNAPSQEENWGGFFSKIPLLGELRKVLDRVTGPSAKKVVHWKERAGKELEGDSQTDAQGERELEKKTLRMRSFLIEREWREGYSWLRA